MQGSKCQVPGNISTRVGALSSTLQSVSSSCLPSLFCEIRILELLVDRLQIVHKVTRSAGGRRIRMAHDA